MLLHRTTLLPGESNGARLKMNPAEAGPRLMNRAIQSRV
jgi:hypothetical protein